MLILDEPTNHLDIPSREALEAALDEYDGTILTVSHDRYFLDKIATQILAFEEDGVQVFNGNYTEYHDWRDVRDTEIVRRGDVQKTTGEGAAIRNGVVPDLESSVSSTLSKNQRERIEKRIADIEIEISSLEEEVAKLTSELASPAITADYTLFREVSVKVTETQNRIQGLYKEWDEKSSELG